MPARWAVKSREILTERAFPAGGEVCDDRPVSTLLPIGMYEPSRDCGYITDEEHAELSHASQEIGRMLGSMIKNPEKFLLNKRKGERYARETSNDDGYGSVPEDSDDPEVTAENIP